MAKMKTKRAVKKWMADEGLSQRDLARIIGVHESTVSRFLHGTLQLGLRPMIKLAAVMGISVEEFFQ